MKTSEYLQHDGLGLAALLRDGEVTTEELTACAKSIADAVNPELGAVIEWFDDLAPERDSAAPDAPFSGVPFLIKDLVLQARGRRTEFGSRLAAGLEAPADSDLMQRFRAAGLVAHGRTAVPEMGYNIATETVAEGETRNPWNLSCSPGGSSGGSAAAVAAGIVPMAHANDGGGSIRIPAACCGLVGLKPGRGRVPIGPAAADGLGGFGIEFAVTRSVRDSAVLLDCVQGSGVGDPYEIASPSKAYASVIERPPEALRIAVAGQPWSGVPVAPGVLAALEVTARRCEAMGHTVEWARPEMDEQAFTAANTDLWAAHIAHWIVDLCAATGRKASLDTLEPSTLAIYEHGLTVSAVDLLHAEDSFNRVSRDFGAFFQGYDLLLTPTTARSAWDVGSHASNVSGFSALSWTEHVFADAPFTAVFNCTGQPAISLPLAQGENGMPIGMQFVARHGREDLLLALAAEFERQESWPRLAPLAAQAVAE